LARRLNSGSPTFVGAQAGLRDIVMADEIERLAAEGKFADFIDQ
jgi:hypothetical protein